MTRFQCALATLLLFTSNSSYGADSCRPGRGLKEALGRLLGRAEKIENSYKYDRELATKKLSEFPQLRKYVLSMLDDPNVSIGLKRNLRKAIEDPNVALVQLNKAVRERYSVPNYTGGFHLRTKRPISFFQTKSELSKPTLNESASRQTDWRKFQEDVTVKTGREYRDIVVVADELPRTVLSIWKDNGLEVLAHELAHARFDEFMAANIDKLIGRFPKSLMFRDDAGQVYIHSQLYTFLTERYAAEAEYEMSLAARGKYSTRLRRPPWIADTEADTKSLIAYYVADVYQITNPEVLALRNRSLKSILLSGVEDSGSIVEKWMKQTRVEPNNGE